jgi:hypothetical protein
MFYSLDNSLHNSNNSNNSNSNNTNPHSKYKNNYDLITTPALNQGANFKNYQNKIKNNIKKKINNVNSREGFQTTSTSENDSGELAEQSKQILSETSSGTDKTLQNEYNVTLLAYQKLLAKISNRTKDYIDRVSPSNSYLNKLIRWTDPLANNAIMYVTNQGVAKPINDKEILKSILGMNGCPDIRTIVNISIPWDSSYTMFGTRIPTIPTLTVGTPMKKGESCGKEGLNVYVDTLITKSKATYKACYADDPSSRTMTFIGGEPASAFSGIENGNFTQPNITKDSYEYITSASKVPGWNFDAILLNESSAWGYPMPYPNGTQCGCIQGIRYFEQTINLSTGTYYLSFIACGRPGYSGANTIDIQLNGETFYSVTPPITEWTVYKSSFSVTTSGNNIIKFLGTIDDVNNSSAFQGILLENSGVSTSSGSYTYDMCKQASIDNGYKYFGLQNVNTETSMGYCAVSNDYVSATRNGESYVISGVVVLWESKTTDTGSYAYLIDQGALSVYNTAGASIYNTDNSKVPPSDYLGCYGDTKTRAMPLHNSGKQKYSYQECRDIAEEGNYKYFGLQNSTSGTNAQCGLSNDLETTRKYGKASNCTKLKDEALYSGGGWSNAVYSFDAIGYYYLILQDDGNMCVYRGTGPNDNQGGIWCSGTNGQQQKPDPKYAAAKGKYGQNWIASGSGLSPGDFVGSTDGSIYLIMQSDGNLVLYTSTDEINCKTMKDNNTGGGENANALYELDEVGIPENMGKVAYIDSDSVLYPYSDSNLGLTDDYITYTNFSSAGHDISGKAFSNATVDSCKTACNDLQNCYRFDFDKINNVCYPKDNTMYPKGSRTTATNSDVDLYVRQQKITKPPKGVTDKILNIDSLAYQNYPKSDKEMGSSYGLPNANSVEKKQLEQLKIKLDQISQELADNTGTLNTDEIKVGNQSTLQTQSINNYLKTYESTNDKIKNFTSGMDGIIRDSDITVLKENYNYLFWSILAVGTVLVTMNVTKK